MVLPQPRPGLRETCVQLTQLAWSIGRRFYRVWPSPDAPPDRWASEEHQRLATLALLRAYREVLEAANVNIDHAISDALGAGASYVDVAAAQGVSRQAVRQRVLRAGQAVQLVGGPRDGSVGKLPHGIGDTVCWPESRYSTRFNFEVVEHEILSCYHKKRGEQGLYDFLGFIDAHGGTVPPARIPAALRASAARGTAPAADAKSKLPHDEAMLELPRRVPMIRVHELAKELGRTSKQVLAALREMEMEARSASSAVAPPIANRLRRHFERLPSNS